MPAVEPGRTPDAPAVEPSRGWLREGWWLARRTVTEIGDDRVLGLSAEAAFWTLLSIPPLALALLGLIGYVAPLFGPDALANVQDSILRNAARVFSDKTVHDTVQPLVDKVVNGRADVVSVGFVLAVWSGSASVSTYIRTITIAYDMPDLRSAWRTRLMGFGLFVAGLGVGMVLLPAIVVGPNTIAELAPGPVKPALTTTVHLVYWPAVVILSVVTLATLYHVSVPVRSPWRRDVPGAVLAMALWLLGSVGLRVYLAVGGGSTTRSSTLGAPIAVLLFLYVSSFAILIGAEVNGEIDRRWPVATTAEGRARQQLRG